MATPVANNAHRQSVLWIATGGTIACQETECGLAPALSAQVLLPYLPAELQERLNITPLELYAKDSTDLEVADILQVAACIASNYAAYDGFLITHGTDTLAYMAAGLSYLIQNSQKPIILTGAQRPLTASDSDGVRNLTDAFAALGRGHGGVFVVFGGREMVGTRAKKLYTKADDAFVSVNYPLLSDGGEAVSTAAEPVFYHDLNPRVLLVHCTPALTAEALLAAVRGMDGVLLIAYGCGGVPHRLLPAVRQLSGAGKVLVIGTTALYGGTDLSLYRVGAEAKAACRLCELADMTEEAAFCKLMWALAQTQNPEHAIALFERPVACDRRLS